MRPRIAHPRDFWAGVMFLVLGAGFAGVALNYQLGTAARMGPGYFPFFLGLLLAFLGLAIALAATRARNPGPGVEKFHWMPLFWVLMPVVAFGLLLKVIGMVLGGVMVVVVSSIASKEFRWKPVLALALGLAVFCSLAFVGGLKLPIPLCPALEVFGKLALCRA